ncbi:MAG: hypothetical protein IBJ10_07460 [Phycisphaerales bacterium]|nr:hypothetical protein [Phycisphaerales bacterium]
MPDAPIPSERRDAPGWLDPGWLFLLPGLVILAATVMVPAQNDLYEAQLARAKSLIAEEHSARRLENYATYLDALRRGDEPLALALAATHLNLSPVGRTAVSMPNDRLDANPFSSLEPPAPAQVMLTPPDTALQRWTTNDRTRLWLTAGGAMCVLIGLLPPTTRRR